VFRVGDIDARRRAELCVMTTVTAASRLADLIGHYSPEVAQVFTAARRKMRALVPRGYELVYENYNALGVGYGPGQKASDVIVSLVAYPKWVTLFFMYGAALKDPNCLLEGTGRRIRGIKLQSSSDIDRPDVKQLASQALRPHGEALEWCARLVLVVRSVASKRRPRLPPKTSAPRNRQKPTKGAV
jgi:hypothetical protein